MLNELINERNELMDINKRNEELIRGYIVITLKEILKNSNNINKKMSMEDILKIIDTNNVKIQDLIRALGE